MRNLIVLFLLSFLSLNSFGQDLNKYFAQGHFNTNDQALIKSVEQSIKEQPGIWMVRIDPTNGNVLVFTTELPFWTKEEFVTLFGMHSALLNCPFVGIVRQDDFKTFPFDDCE
jgi:hypothetical protein